MSSDIPIEETNLTVAQFWKRVEEGPKDTWKTIIEIMLQQFGTALSCNRFGVGEVIEQATADYLKTCGIKADCVPSAKRIDIEVKNVESLPSLSCKFVSCGKDVVLHNSQRKTNTDFTVSPTLLFLTTEWWFLDPPRIAEHKIDIKNHLNNTGDSLQLKFTLLEELRKVDYPYHMKFIISYEKPKALMKSISDLTYKFIKDLYDPATPPATREYIRKTLEDIPSRRPVTEDKPKKPRAPRKQKTDMAVSTEAKPKKQRAPRKKKTDTVAPMPTTNIIESTSHT
jgi:hypothetical protein